MADTLAPEKAVAPEGVYLTDGKRLAEVLGLDAENNFRLADCAGNTDDLEAVITVTKDELLRDWKRVHRAKDDEDG